MKLYKGQTLAFIFAVASACCAAQNAQPSGKVILSRSTDQNGQTTNRGGQAATTSTAQMTAAPAAVDAEREAVTYTDFDMDVRVRAGAQQIAIRALVSVRNDGKTPLSRIPLHISSSH
jgi:carbon monoxide dehydrogenase subunit G